MYEEDKKRKSERKQNKPRPNDGRDFQRESTHSQLSIGLRTKALFKKCVIRLDSYCWVLWM